jgi:polar amino acid transport system substrate-binding protein
MSSRRIAAWAVIVVGGAAVYAGCGSDKESGASSSSSGGNAKAAAASCTPKHKFSTLAPGTLTVSSVTYPPFLEVRDDGTLGGVDGVLVDKVAALECLKVKLVKTTANGLVPSVQSGRADLSAAYAYRTKDRAKVVGLTDPLYSANVFLVSKDGKITNVDQLKGKRVGSTGGNLFNEDIAKIPGVKFKSYENEKQWMQDLMNGRLDAAVDGAGGESQLENLGYTQLKYVVAQPNPLIQATLKPAQVGWPVTKDNQELLTALNEDIATMHSDGTIEEALKKFGLSPESAKVGPPDLL